MAIGRGPVSIRVTVTPWKKEVGIVFSRK